ncbi:glycosyltransferase family 8 protein [Floccifex sp.]|uniref:glycosyltransferase family 8 protein n=1 Tax=Floccifex sp. TaxID=2815810 RepID=UPI0029FF260C|nr:glycosyltransferase [Floccifex sp.]MDD7281946.1 glycosyltransferase family 8 protein [Erysipelotrichaceae bacterium]MDY2959107.1 glycosyltransferase family 8 protein [Floccifex sp.]
MNILLSINEKFLSLTKNCISSMIRFDEDFDFYILHHDISLESQQDMMATFPNQRFHFIYVDESTFSSFPISNRYPLEIYYRLFASDLLPQDLDRILYMDVDIVVIQSLKELYDTDFEGNAYCACTHVDVMMTKINSKRLKMEETNPYINTGVLLMNLEMLRKIVNREHILSFVEQNKNRMILFDQDVLSALYGDKTKLLDYRYYNLSDRMVNVYNMKHPTEKIDLDWIREHSVIIHYCGRNKPWSDRYKGNLGIFYKELMD